MSTLPLPRERVPYTAIVDRPPLKLPGGARMAVWVIVNVEDWGIERPMNKHGRRPGYVQSETGTISRRTVRASARNAEN